MSYNIGSDPVVAEAVLQSQVRVLRHLSYNIYFVNKETKNMSHMDVSCLFIQHENHGKRIQTKYDPRNFLSVAF